MTQVRRYSHWHLIHTACDCIGVELGADSKEDDMNTMKRSLRLALAALGLMFVADAAQACTFECVPVGSCMRCQNVGDYTGGYCKNAGSCGCFNTVGICFNSASMTEAEQLLANLSDPFQADALADDQLSTPLTATGADQQ